MAAAQLGEMGFDLVGFDLGDVAAAAAVTGVGAGCRKGDSEGYGQD